MSAEVLGQIAASEVARFLEQHLPPASSSSWRERVLAALTPEQHRIALERRKNSIRQFDLAALLRVLEHNWSSLAPNSVDGRRWIQELRATRARWAHRTVEAETSSEELRDIDTVRRVLSLLNASADALHRLDAEWGAALSRAQSSHPTGKVTEADATDPRTTVLNVTKNPIAATPPSATRFIRSDTSPSPTLDEIWIILRELAAKQTTMFYGEVAAKFGIKWDAKIRSHMIRVLSRVAQECQSEAQPILAALVVNREEGLPGPGFNKFLGLPEEATPSQRRHAFEEEKRRIFAAYSNASAR